MGTTTKAFRRMLRPGVTRDGSLYVRVEWDGERLSLSGVEGPKRNGDARGSCGQCEDALSRLVSYAPEWTPERAEALRATWERWHLNDMRAGCEHQRAAWDPSESIEVVSYRLTSEAHKLRREALEEAESAAREGRVAELTPTGRALLRVDWYKALHAPPDADSPLAGCYEVDKRETKRAGWVYPTEHPKGLLTKPCGVCGYKYGSEWKREEVPDDVLAFLVSLPESDIPCPWGTF